MLPYNVLSKANFPGNIEGLEAESLFVTLQEV